MQQRPEDRPHQRGHSLPDCGRPWYRQEPAAQGIALTSSLASILLFQASPEVCTAFLTVCTLIACYCARCVHHDWHVFHRTRVMLQSSAAANALRGHTCASRNQAVRQCTITGKISVNIIVTSSGCCCCCATRAVPVWANLQYRGLDCLCGEGPSDWRLCS